MLDALTFGKVDQDILNLTFSDFYYRLSLLAQNVFVWDGLPGSMEGRYIERFLFHEGRCMIYNDTVLGPVVAKCADAGMLNYYDEPVSLSPVIANCQAPVEPLKVGTECIYLPNNDMAIPTNRSIMLFAYRLAEIKRTADVNIKAQKTPVLIKCTDKQRLSMARGYDKFDGNHPVVFVDKSLEDGQFTVLKTDAPKVFPDLRLEFNREWQDAMTFIGVNNANTDKRERLTDDEVAANNAQIELSAQVMLQTRLKAAEQISEFFGCTVSVRVNDKLKCDPPDLNPDQKGGVEND